MTTRTTRLLELNLSPDERTLKQFGFIALIAFGLLAACAFYERWMFSFGLGSARTAVAVALAAVGVLAGLSSLVHPKANRVVYVGLSVLAYPIGLVLSYVIMGTLFFAIFAPTGALLRLGGKDPMQRGFRRDQASYWTPARPRRSKESYFRQF